MLNKSREAICHTFFLERFDQKSQDLPFLLRSSLSVASEMRLSDKARKMTCEGELWGWKQQPYMERLEELPVLQ